MVPSGRVIGFADEECFADELIKMSHQHFAHQGARMTRAVKIAHAGRALARRQELEKEAISLGGIKTLIGNMAGAASRLRPRAGAAASGVASKVRSAVGRVRGAKATVPTPSASAPTPKPSAPAPKPTANIPQPTAGGVTARPIHQVGPTPQVAPRPAPQPPTQSPAAQGAAAPKPGLLGRVFGGAKKIVHGGTQGAGALAEGATKGEKALNWAGRLAAGAAGYDPDTASNIAGAGALYGGSKIVGGVKKMLANRALKKDVGKSLKGLSSKAVGDAGVIGGMGLKSFGQEGMQAAAQMGMSPKQLHALDELASAGAEMPRGARRKIERAAGVSMDEIQSMGGVDNVLRNRAAQAGAVAAAPAAAGRVAAGGGGGGMFSGLGGTALKVGVPVAVGLAGSAAYGGMQNLAERNRTTQYQHGTASSPLNYSPTSAFPAGQIMY